MGGLVATLQQSLQQSTQDAAAGSADPQTRRRKTAEEWCRDHGMPGFPTHFQRPRPELWTARLMQVMGMPVPADLATRCPRGKLLGADCPICNEPGAWTIPEGNWHIPPGENGHTRLPDGPDRRFHRYMHTLGSCPKICEKLHRHCKAKGVSVDEARELFAELPVNQEPGALPS